MPCRGRVFAGLLPLVALALVWLPGGVPPWGRASAAEPVAAPVPATATATKDAPLQLNRDLTTAGKKPAENDILLLAYGDDPDTLNPVTGTDTVSEAFQSRVYEALANTEFRDPDKFEPALATHWEFDAEKLEFTIHLRKGVMWHPMRLPNGKMLPETEFTARDVVFTFQCVLNKHVEAAHIRNYYEDPEAKDKNDPYKIKVRMVDKYTIKIRWTKPYMLAKEFTLSAVAIIPRHVYSVDASGEPISFDFSSKEFAEGFNNHWANKLMCGTGPMMFKQWTRGERLELVRNPNYWGPPYYFSGVTYRCIFNPNTMTQKLLQNDIDFCAIAEKDRYLQSKEHPNVKDGKVRLVDYTYPGYRYVGYNLQRDLFKDSQFRRALAHAVPIRKIIDQVFKGLAEPTAGPFLPGSSAYDSGVTPIPYDLDKARQILDEAGWKDSDGDGIRDKMLGTEKVAARFDLMIYSEAPSFRTVAEVMKEEFRKIGVEVNISPAKWALMLQKLGKKEFDAAMLGWALPWRQDPFQVWHGSQADLPNSSNHVGYKSAEVDKLIDQLRVTLDEAKQKELYHRIHRMIYDDQPYLFLFVDRATGGYHSRLENIKFYKVRPCYDGREWWASAPRLQGQ